MSYQFSIKLENGFPEPLRIVIEPWATEHWLSPKDYCEVRAVSEEQEPYITIDAKEYGMIFWVEGEGATTYEYWENGIFIE